jgi:hypothetical protein
VTRELRFTGAPADAPGAPKLPCYRALDAAGRPLPGAAVPHPLGEAEAVALYTAMARLQVMDTIFYEAQRQVGASLGGGWGLAAVKQGGERRGGGRARPPARGRRR